MIEELRQIEFHDLPVKSLSLDFNDNSIELFVKDYNQSKKDYFGIKIRFDDTSCFSFEKTVEMSISDIYSCSIKEENSRYFIKFILISHRPVISCEVSFYFKTVRLEYLNAIDW